MTPGPVEEAGKVASSAVEALKSTPVVLALVIFNVLFMLLITYVSIKSDQIWANEQQRMHELMNAMLRACPPPR
jgi:hypothetical protein